MTASCPTTPSRPCGCWRSARSSCSASISCSRCCAATSSTAPARSPTSSSPAGSSSRSWASRWRRGRPPPAPSPTTCASSRACATSSPRPRSRPWSICRSCCPVHRVIVGCIGGPLALVPAVAVPLVIGVGLLLQLPLNRVVRRDLREAAQKHGVLVESDQRPGDDQERRRRGPDAARLGAVRRRDRPLGRPGSRFLSAFGRQLRRRSPQTSSPSAWSWSASIEIGAGQMTIGALIACTILAGRAMAPLAPGRRRAHPLPSGAGGAGAARQRSWRCRSSGRARPASCTGRELAARSSSRTSPSPIPGQKLPALADVSFKIAAGRAGRPDRPDRLRQDDGREAGARALRAGPAARCWSTAPTCARSIPPTCAATSAACRRTCSCSRARCARTSRSARPSPTIAAVLRAARIAGVEEFVARHPLGYDLNVGERGESALGRPAPGDRDRPGAAPGPADPGARRADQLHGQCRREPLQGSAWPRSCAGRTLMLVTHRASLLIAGRPADRARRRPGGRRRPARRGHQGAGRRPHPGAGLRARWQAAISRWARPAGCARGRPPRVRPSKADADFIVGRRRRRPAAAAAASAMCC